MRYLLFALLFTLLATQVAYADYTHHVVTSPAGEDVFKSSERFKVFYCQTSACEKTMNPSFEEKMSPETMKALSQSISTQIRDSFYQRGFQEEGVEFGKVTLLEVKQTLETDFDLSNGEMGWKSEDLDPLMDWLEADEPFINMSRFNLRLGYHGGSEAIEYFFIFHAEINWVTVIRKDIWSD